MIVHYTGRNVDLSAEQIAQVEADFAKLSRLIDGRGEYEAHVVVAQQRHLRKVEVTVPWRDHTLVGEGSGTDLAAAIHDAIDKTTKQAVKIKSRLRDTKRKGPKTAVAVAVATNGTPAARTPPPRINKVTQHNRRKPVTFDEALLEMTDDKAYVVYRDVRTSKVCVIVRRLDGNLDYIEA